MLAFANVLTSLPAPGLSNRRTGMTAPLHFSTCSTRLPASLGAKGDAWERASFQRMSQQIPLNSAIVLTLLPLPLLEFLIHLRVVFPHVLPRVVLLAPPDAAAVATEDADGHIRGPMRYLNSGEPMPMAHAIAVSEQSRPGNPHQVGALRAPFVRPLSWSPARRHVLKHACAESNPFHAHNLLSGGWLGARRSPSPNTSWTRRRGLLYGLLHGTPTRDRLAGVGERVLWCVPKKASANVDYKWK